MVKDLADRYLARLGLTKAPTARDLYELAVILEAHLRAIPFENVSSFTGTPVSLVPGDVCAKLLEGRRGGYCMEHALLSRLALAALGFQVEAVLARVYVGPGSERASAQTHCATVVHIHGKEFLFDPGFGAQTPSIPVALDSGGGQQVGSFGTYRIVGALEAQESVGRERMGGDITRVLQSFQGGRWLSLYGMTRRPVVDADIIAFNWFVSTCPSSFFTHNVMCAKWDGEIRVTSFDRRFKRIEAGELVEATVNSEADVKYWFCDQLCLHLNDILVGQIWQKLRDCQTRTREDEF